MGAGEQRVFEILMQIFSARQYALILIDEIDLLLHGDALKRLLSVIANRAEERNLQIIFTTHRESVIGDASVRMVRHLYAVPSRTMWLSRSTPDAMRRLVGAIEAPLECFVEDDVAAAIVRRVAFSLGVARHLKISRVGSADNGFAVLCGLALSDDPLTNVRYLLDGDRYINETERRARVNRILTGDDDRSIARRGTVMNSVTSLNAPNGQCPEQVLRNLIAGQAEPTDPEVREIWRISQELVAVGDRHEFVNRIIEPLGMDRASALQHIVAMASLAGGWDAYTQSIRAWLSERAADLE
jgi:hypothetical protein